jgi:folate-binding protein YgfZ
MPLSPEPQGASQDPDRDPVPEATAAGGVALQIERARSTVLALRPAGVATLVVTGKDRVGWLNGLITCDLVKRSAGEARYGLIVVKNGRVLSDATVVVCSEAVEVVLPAALAETVRTHLDHYLVMEDAEMATGTDSVAVWMLHGPRAEPVLAEALRAGAYGGHLDRTGLGGAVVLVPAEREDVGAALARAIEAAGGMVGDEAGWEALRLERGVPRFGVDFDDKMYPQEASLERVAVSFDKGCYLGQEVVCMLEMRGHVKRKLVPIVLDGAEVPAPGAEVTDASGAPAGNVTSATSSPTLGKAVALAMVKRAQSEPGKRLVVGGVHAEVVARPA